MAGPLPFDGKDNVPAIAGILAGIPERYSSPRESDACRLNIQRITMNIIPYRIQHNATVGYES